MRLLLCALLMSVTGLAYGQSVKSGAPVTLYSPTQTASASAYSTQTYVDLQSYDSAGIQIYCFTPALSSEARIKYQWSPDATNWYDEYVLSPGTASSTEQPYTALARRVDMATTTSGTVYSERVRRQMRYFRPSVIASSSTTASVLIKVQAMNNQN